MEHYEKTTFKNNSNRGWCITFKNKFIEENCPNLKEMPNKVKETYRTPNRLNQKRKSP